MKAIVWKVQHTWYLSILVHHHIIEASKRYTKKCVNSSQNYAFSILQRTLAQKRTPLPVVWLWLISAMNYRAWYSVRHLHWDWSGEDWEPNYVFYNHMCISMGQLSLESMCTSAVNGSFAWFAENVHWSRGKFIICNFVVNQYHSRQIRAKVIKFNDRNSTGLVFSITS